VPKTVQDRAIVTIEHELEVAMIKISYDLE